MNVVKIMPETESHTQGMRVRLDFNGQVQYLTKKAALELVRDLSQINLEIA